MGASYNSGGQPGLSAGIGQQLGNVMAPGMGLPQPGQPGGKGGPSMNPGYNNPYTPRPDLGPDVGFGVGLPQPGQGFNPLFGGGQRNPNNPFDMGGGMSIMGGSQEMYDQANAYNQANPITGMYGNPPPMGGQPAPMPQPGQPGNPYGDGSRPQPLPPGVSIGFPEQGMPGQPPMGGQTNQQPVSQQIDVNNLSGDYSPMFGSSTPTSTDMFLRGYRDQQGNQYDQTGKFIKTVNPNPTPMPQPGQGGGKSSPPMSAQPMPQPMPMPVPQPVNRYAPPAAPVVRPQPVQRPGIPVQQARTIAPRPAPAPMRPPAFMQQPTARAPAMNQYTRTRAPRIR